MWGGTPPGAAGVRRPWSQACARMGRSLGFVHSPGCLYLPFWVAVDRWVGPLLCPELHLFNISAIFNVYDG